MKWIINYAPLYANPGQPQRLCWLPVGTLVEPTGQMTTVNAAAYCEVTYVTALQTYRGWVYAGYLEEVVNEFAPCAVQTTTQTPNPNDAAQDLVYLGGVQYNLCGEFCVAYVAGDSIEHFLAQWQPKSPSIFNRVFSGGRSRPTGAGDVQDMLSVYGLHGQDVSGLLYDMVKGGVLLSPGRMAAISQLFRIIVGVKIDGLTGNLRGQGVGHWVCIEKVIPDGNGRGWVEFYNPFPNQVQREPWATFVGSMGTQPYGLAVKDG